jgi:cation diffusion facilitator family transporter
MHTQSIEPWIHSHVFGQDRKKSAERRTLAVVLITIVTMVVEIAAGIAFGSMALLADGLHMGSHASALAISVFAYYYTRRHANDSRFNFGTGKVNFLAAFASAVMLVLFAFFMVGESVKRFIAPVPIAFDLAILVAILGLVVNGACLFILGGGGDSHDHSGHAHSHEHLHSPANSHDTHSHPHHDFKRSDHNLWAAYLHVLADALTSLLAIFALLGGKYLGLNWLDPVIGIIGAVLVLRWSWGLLGSSARVLLDMQAPNEIREKIRAVVESDGDNRVSDLHVWVVGPDIYAAEISLVSSQPVVMEESLVRAANELGIVHITIEKQLCNSRS